MSESATSVEKKNNLILINQVEGFDPLNFVRLDEKTQSPFLDVKTKRLWFRHINQTGRIEVIEVHCDDQYARYEARVFPDKDDANYAGNAHAQAFRSDDPEYGLKFAEIAESNAVSRALSNAGFDDPISESLPKVPYTEDSVCGIALSSSPAVSPPVSSPADSPSASPVKPAVKPAGPVKPVISNSMNVDEIIKLMTLEEAKRLIIDIGKFKGKTIGEVAIDNPGMLGWYVNTYSGPNNLLRAAAKLLIDAALEQAG